MERILKLYTYIDGVNDIPFPIEEPIVITNFKYVASRSKVPILSATIYHSKCLDDLWNYKQYIIYNNEKYWVSKIPSSLKDNTNSRYKYEIDFTSERNVLFNIYFYDTVDSFTDDITIGNKYCSYSLNVEFYGTIFELAQRINASLKHSNINYTIIVDDNLHEDKKNATKYFSCNAMYVGDALNQASELYDIPIYYVGNTVHFGYYSTYINNIVLEYGAEKSLLSVQRNNANEKLITRVTGVGSTTNIPYYYPNNSEKGNIKFSLFDNSNNDITSDITVSNYQSIAKKIKVNEIYTYKKVVISNPTRIDILHSHIFKNNQESSWDIGEYIDVVDAISSDTHTFTINFRIYDANLIQIDTILTNDDFYLGISDFKYIELFNNTYNHIEKSWNEPDDNIFNEPISLNAGIYTLTFRDLDIGKAYPTIRTFSYFFYVELTVPSISTTYKWSNQHGDYISSLADIGISYEESDDIIGYHFIVDLLSRVPIQPNLMPSIYSRGIAFDGAIQVDKKGYARFYDAINNTYNIDNQEIVFKNEINPYNISEKYFQYDDIKPEIKGIRNANNELICEIIDIAYDENDSDEIDLATNEYLHPYFYIKLRAFSGKYGFNLFDHAIEKGEMTIQFTSGNLNGCKCEVQGVKKEGSESFKFLNPVQVENGNIVAGDLQDKINTNNIIDSQQDTINNEVWIAILKDISTFGVIMPNVTMNYRPQIGDTFNIIHILLPEVYILDAERRLDNALILDLQKENNEYFNYPITFSQIFLAQDYEKNGENSIVKLLDESSKIDIMYNGRVSSQYISSYTYECDDDSPLPKITIELVPTIKHYTTFLENIRKENDNKIKQQESKVLTTINRTITQQTENKANKADTLSGYGIKDAKIDEDGTIILGEATIKPITELDSIDGGTF